MTGSAPLENQCPSTWPTSEYEYNDRGNVVHIMDRDPKRVTTYDYANCNKAGRIDYPSSSSTDPSQTTFKLMTFDAASRVTNVLERNGSETTTVYDEAGRVSESVTALGTPSEARWRYGYHLDRPADSTRRTRADTARTDILDFRGNTLFRLASGGFQESWEFDEKGYPSAHTDPEGLMTTFETDLMGRVRRGVSGTRRCTKLSPGTSSPPRRRGSRRFSYDPKGRLVGRRRSGSGQYAFDYDALDRLTHAYVPSLRDRFAASTTVFDREEYRPVREPDDLRETRGTGSIFYVNDGLGRVTTRTRHSASGDLVEHMDYDNVGNVTRIDSPNGVAGGSGCVPDVGGELAFATTFEWSPLDQLERITGRSDAEGDRHSERREYYPWGSLEMLTDARGFATGFYYDDAMRLKLRRAADGTEYQLEDDANGNTVGEIDERNLRTELAYDLFDRLTEINTPTNRTVFDDDDRGALVLKGVLVDEAAGRWETEDYRYTPDGLLGSMALGTFTGDVPTTATVSPLAEQFFAYHQSGLLAATQDANGNVHKYEYDNRNRMIEEWLPPVAGGDWDVVSYRYDAGDRLKRIIRPMGGPTGPATVKQWLRYDDFGRVRAMGCDQVAATQFFTYDADDNLCRDASVSSSGVQHTLDFTYSPRGDMVTRHGGEIDETFGYDENGNLVTAEEKGSSWAFDYDELQRLTQVSQTPTGL